MIRIPFPKARWLRICLLLSPLGLLVILLLGAWVGNALTVEWAKRGCLGFSPTWQQAPPPPLQTPNQVRFVALGDTGRTNQAHLNVVDGIRQVCQRKGCDFILLLGDNFYPSGVPSTQHPHWKETFANTYGRLNLPIYALLGNHDARTNAWAQIQYAQLDPRWHMLDVRYQLDLGPLRLYALNTNCQAAEWHRLAQHLDQDNADPPNPNQPKPAWMIAAGHRPVFSTGKHKDLNWFVRKIWQQSASNFHLFLSGHSHLLEHLYHPSTNTVHITSGAGAPTALDLTANANVHSSKAEQVFRYTSAGFVWLHATPTQLKSTFHNAQGKVLHTTTQTK